MSNSGLDVLFVTVIVLCWKSTTCEDYILGVVQFNSLDVLIGDEPGWIKRPSNSVNHYGPYNKMNFPVDQSYAVTSGIEDKTYFVQTSDTDLNLYSYHDYMQFSPLPITALGTRYIVSTCHGSAGYTSMLVLASHNQTVVNITFRMSGSVIYGGKVYRDGDTLILSLGFNQTFTIQSDYDLSGSVINTKETVAVFSGVLYEDYANVTHLVSYDQVLPVVHLGQEYVVAVDDNPVLYRLKIVTEYSDTNIMFNNGSTVSIGNSRVYYGYLEINTTIHFNTTRPVITSICREAELQSGCLFVPPVYSYVNQSGVYLHISQTFKVVTERDAFDVTVDTNPPSSFGEEWQDIRNTRFKVATYSTGGSASYYISTDTSKFTVFVYRPFYIYNGGYDIPDSMNTTKTAPPDDNDRDDGDGNEIIIGMTAAGTGLSLTPAMAYGGYALIRRRRRRRRMDEDEAEKIKQYGLNEYPPHPPPGGGPPLARV